MKFIKQASAGGGALAKRQLTFGGVRLVAAAIKGGRILAKFW